jgi:hypothetical protein
MDKRHQLPLVGHVHRVDPKDLGGTRDPYRVIAVE